MLRVDSGELRVGDTLHFRGPNTDFYQRVASIQRDGLAVGGASAGQQVDLQVGRTTSSGDEVTRIA